MARAANQKLKCLYLWQFLLQNTDEEHPATIPQMIEYLARHDIPAERKSLYDDIEALRQCGLDVEYRKAQGGGYYVASREFQLPELKLLVDAVQSSKFLSLRKSNALITKLEKLASRYEAQALRRQHDALADVHLLVVVDRSRIGDEAPDILARRRVGYDAYGPVHPQHLPKNSPQVPVSACGPPLDVV